MGIFSGLVFFIIGTFSKKQEEVKIILISNGATIAKSISQSDTTHVLKGNTKKSPWTEVNSKREVKNKLYVVPYDWIEACLNAGCRVDESDFTEENLDENQMNQEDEEVEEERKPVASTSKGKGKRERSPSPTIIAEPTNIIKVLKKGKWPVDHRMKNNHQYKLVPYTDGIPYDAMLNLTNIANNNNKFYGIQVLQSEEDSNSFFTINVWGRVGDAGQIKVLPYSNLELALKEFHRKFEDKTKLTWENRNDPPIIGKYTFLERSYDDDEEEEESAGGIKTEGLNGSPKKAKVDDEASVVISKLKIEVQNLMKFIFNISSIQQTLSSFEYDANKLPLGKLSKSSLELGFATLKDIEAILRTPSLASSTYQFTSAQKAFTELTNRYYTLIPHSFGRSKPPLISTDSVLQRELRILGALGEIKITQEIIKEAGANVDQKGKVLHPLDSQFQQLGLNKFEVIDESSSQFKVLESLLVNTKGSTHTAWDLELLDAFEVEREEESIRWNEADYSSPTSGTRKLLFHGSRSSNFGGILSQGLRIASDTAPASGFIFGRGIYLTSMSSKAATYCYHGVSDNEGLLLLCETQCGKEPMYKLEKSEYEADILSKEAGFSATWGVGRIQPSKYEDAGILSSDLKGLEMPSSESPPSEINQTSSLLYDEFVFYQVDRVRIRYLLRVAFNEVD